MHILLRYGTPVPLQAVLSNDGSHLCIERRLLIFESRVGVCLCVQGAGGMLGAVVAIYAELQPLPADGLIRAPKVPWPLEEAGQAWDQWIAYHANFTASPYLETAVVYATIPGIGIGVLLVLCM